MENKVMNMDVLDLCNILKALGFTIKDIYKDRYVSDSTEKYIQIKCNTSGIKVVLESKDTKCSCPEMEDNDENNGKWEMSGTSGGVQVSKTQSGSAFHREFNNETTEHIRREMTNIIEMIKIKPIKPITPNKIQPNLSISSSCLHMSPPRIAHQIKVDTPSRYRSLDTLNDAETNSVFLPEPRKLGASQKLYLIESQSDLTEETKIKSTDRIKFLPRQNTYTTSATDSSHEPRTMPPSRTSSPVSAMPAIVMLNLHHAEKLAEELLMVIQESIMSSEAGNFPDNKSVNSAMDVSKISSIQQSAQKPRARSASIASTRSVPFSSSPNLCRIQETLKPPSMLSMKRLSLKSPSIPQYNKKPSSSKLSLPKSSSSGNSISPSGIMGMRKSTGMTGVYGNQISGSYKTLSDKSALSTSGGAKSKFNSFKSPINPTTEEIKPKKKNSLYSHIKSTIPKPSLSAKKE